MSHVRYFEYIIRHVFLLFYFIRRVCIYNVLRLLTWHVLIDRRNFEILNSC
jgi:hypothetical protein